MKLLETICAKLIRSVLLVGLSLLVGVSVWAQTDNPPAQPPVPAMVGVDNSADPADTYDPETSGDRMMTPPPVSGQTYPVTLSSEERSNYFVADCRSRPHTWITCWEEPIIQSVTSAIR